MEHYHTFVDEKGNIQSVILRDTNNRKIFYNDTYMNVSRISRVNEVGRFSSDRKSVVKVLSNGGFCPFGIEKRDLGLIKKDVFRTQIIFREYSPSFC
jgi:hypothetical protein